MNFDISYSTAVWRVRVPYFFKEYYISGIEPSYVELSSGLRSAFLSERKYPIEKINIISHNLEVMDEDMVKNISPPCKKAATFSAILHRILANTDNQHVITWLPHGRSWRVLDSAAFEKYIIPKYFRHNRFPSFLRQVGGWGFCCVLDDDGKRSYQNKVRKLLFVYLCSTSHIFVNFFH